MRSTVILRLLAAALVLAPPHAFALTRLPAQVPANEFRIYDGKGVASGLDELVGVMLGADAVLIGEGHADATGHKLEFELLRRLFARAATEKPPRAVALSLEMFERDVQTILDEYLAGLIGERQFLAAVRPWKNYETDYRPLVELAREREFPVVAANAPARYVSRVAQSGPDSLRGLSKEALSWLPPLPAAPASRDYADKFARLMGGPSADSPHGASFLLDAQNLRDAAMGHAVAEHLKRQRGALVVHVNGRFHSEGCLGVAEHLLRLRPKTRVLVVTIISPRSFPAFDQTEHAGLGDFVVLTDPKLSRPD